MSQHQNLTITNSQGPELPAAYLAGMVNGYLRAHKRVLLLLPGGSSIAVAAQAYHLIDNRLRNGLACTLTDERYGDVGHPDSNWLQLEQAGVPVATDPNMLPVLRGKTMEETVDLYNRMLEQAMSAAEVVVGIFGMGADGHTCGVLPGSPAVDSPAYVVGYDAGSFQRMTMTPQAIARVDDAILCLSGEEKRPAFERFKQDLSVQDQPAQVLKKIPALAVFTPLAEPSAI